MRLEASVTSLRTGRGTGTPSYMNTRKLPCSPTESLPALARPSSSTFKSRPGTRSFGTPTCGHHHLQQSFRLSDGATLFLASSQHADRTKRRHAARIDPDEIIVDPGEAVRRAIAWLQGGS